MYNFKNKLLDLKRVWEEKKNALTLKEIFKILISGVSGSLIGIFTSAIVNSTLVEISLNIFFSIYFGLIFLFIGGLLLFRILNMKQEDKYSIRRKALIFFAALIIISGIISLSFLEHKWYSTFPPEMKIPIYIILAITLNFSIIFGIIDIVNYTFGVFQRNYDKTIVESQIQIIWVFVVSLVMGFLYGFIFGFLDVEDAKRFEFQAKLLHEEFICLPIAALLGFLGGVVNEYLRIKGHDAMYFQPGKAVKDPFTEEI